MSKDKKNVETAEEIKIADGDTKETEETKVTEETAKEETDTKAGEEAKAEEKPEEKAEEKAEESTAKLDPKDAKIAELNDKLLRQMAEFENFRKRTEREKAQMFDSGMRSAIEKILPVADNFDRAFEALTEEQLKEPFVVGIDKVYKQLQTVFEALDIKEIDALGKEFDPNFHNAIMHEDKEDAGENIITEVYQKGYTCHDTVLRHSMVKVAN